MGIFSDIDANDVFGSGSGGFDTAGVGANPNNISWTDKIFGTVSDFGTEYLKVLGTSQLDNLRMQNAGQEQANLIGFTEVPQNVGVSPAATYVPAQASSGGPDSKMLLIAALVAAYVFIK